MKIRVYAIPDCDDVHELSNEDFINNAEGLGYVWSLSGFQNVLNCEDFTPMNVMLEALKQIELDYTNLNNQLDIDYSKEQ